MGNTISVIVMTTSHCNLQCKYCYATTSQDKTSKFEVDNIKTMIHNSSLHFDNVDFCWLGGEPLMAGLDFFENVVEIQEQEKKYRNVKFQNSIQSSGVLLDDKWLTFFQENEFHLGLSFDAPFDVGEIHREVKKEQMISICEMIHRYQLPLRTLCVTSKLNVNRGEEIFNLFKSLGVNSYSLLPLKSVPLSYRPLLPNEEELYLLYKTTFDLWMETENNFSSIEPLDTMLRSILGSPPALCSFSAPCIKKMVTITQSGKVVPCGSLALDQFVFGDILQKSLLEILNDKAAKKLRNYRDEHISSTCKGCEYLSICRGGCRSEAFWHTGDFKGDIPFCETHKKMFGYMIDRLHHLN